MSIDNTTIAIAVVIIFAIWWMRKKNNTASAMKANFDPLQIDPRNEEPATETRNIKDNPGEIAESNQVALIAGARQDKSQGVSDSGAPSRDDASYIDGFVKNQVVTPAIAASHAEYMKKNAPYYGTAALFAQSFDPTAYINRTGILAVSRAQKTQQLASFGTPTQVTGIDAEDYADKSRAAPQFM